MKNAYDAKARKKIRQTMKEWKAGKLKSGRSGKIVKSQKQAVAIGISEARREGDRVPDKKKQRSG
jgi:hypothetical protein